LSLWKGTPPEPKSWIAAMTIPERISSPPMKTIAERMLFVSSAPYMLFTTTNATPAMNSTAARNWDLRRFTTTPPGKAYIASQILFLSISFSLLIVCISFVNR